MSITSLVSKIGTNPYFIAFNAHAGFAFAALTFAPHHLAIWISAALLAALKEFWFDAKYEQPPQTFIDNATDWLGYAVGITLAAWRYAPNA